MRLRKHSEKTKIAWPKIMQSKIENTQFSTKREKGKVYRGGALTRWRADSAVAVSTAACTAPAVATVAVASATFFSATACSAAVLRRQLVPQLYLSRSLSLQPHDPPPLAKRHGMLLRCTPAPRSEPSHGRDWVRHRRLFRGDV